MRCKAQIVNSTSYRTLPQYVKLSEEMKGEQSLDAVSVICNKINYHRFLDRMDLYNTTVHVRKLEKCTFAGGFVEIPEVGSLISYGQAAAFNC